MANKKSKIKYYSLNKILTHNATYNVIFGERSNGKTYSVLEYAIKEYFKTGGQLAIVRRWQEDIRGKRSSDIFTGINMNGVVEKYSNGEYAGICYYAGKLYVCNYDDNQKPIYNDGDVFGFVFALSDTEHNKSISYPKIQTILFDEFLTRGLYLQDEFILFMNTISTIVRLRTDVKIFMLGNTVNKYCPYFTEMGLEHILKMEQGAIDIYKYGNSDLTVAVEYCTSMQQTKASNKYFAFNNPKLQMITNGAWELDIYPHVPIKYKPSDVLFPFFIKFGGEIYQCEIIMVDDMMFIYIHIKTTEIQDNKKDLIYSLEYSPQINYNRNIFNPTNRVGAVIKKLIITNKVFYQDNTVGDSINNYFKICRGGY